MAMAWWADVLLAVGLALFFGLSAALVLEAVKARALRPALERIRRVNDALIAERARSHGYTLHLVSEAGDEIGVQEGGRFVPSWYRPGTEFVYRSVTYEVVSVQDDYPMATGTLVLRPVPG